MPRRDADYRKKRRGITNSHEMLRCDAARCRESLRGCDALPRAVSPPPSWLIVACCGFPPAAARSSPRARRCAPRSAASPPPSQTAAAAAHAASAREAPAQTLARSHRQQPFAHEIKTNNSVKLMLVA
eukprot:5225913-Pleurochrysis_carterae.AAC.3